MPIDGQVVNCLWCCLDADRHQRGQFRIIGKMVFDYCRSNREANRLCNLNPNAIENGRSDRESFIESYGSKVLVSLKPIDFGA